MSTHYFECHVTTDPVPDDRLEQFIVIASRFQFRVAKLLLRRATNDPVVPYQDDTFLTARGYELSEMETRVNKLCAELQKKEFVVRRYKIEFTLHDSNKEDSLKIMHNFRKTFFN